MRLENHNFWLHAVDGGHWCTIWAEHSDGASKWRSQVNRLWIPDAAGGIAPADLLREIARQLETPYLDRPRPPA